MLPPINTLQEVKLLSNPLCPVFLNLPLGIDNIFYGIFILPVLTTNNGS